MVSKIPIPEKSFKQVSQNKSGKSVILAHLSDLTNIVVRFLELLLSVNSDIWMNEVTFKRKTVLKKQLSLRRSSFQVARSFHRSSSNCHEAGIFANEVIKLMLIFCGLFGFWSEVFCTYL